MTNAAEQFTGVAAGVPYVAFAPAGGARPDAPIVVAWHLLDAPRTEAALAAALPLAGLDAWRIYFGLPMTGSRLPAGGFEELMGGAMEDAVLRLHGPISAQAAGEFPAAFAAVRSQLGIGEGPVAVVGGSLGAAVAQQVLLETDLPVRAAVLVSPVTQLRPMVDTMSAMYGMTYEWSAASLEHAARLDFVARADETAKRGEPAVLIVVGGGDHPDAFVGPATALRDELRSRYADPARVSLSTIDGMEHAFADEPGVEAAPQTPHAAEIDRQAAEWLQRHLIDAAGDGSEARP